jgi:DNA-directed RNA polymerase specialized sigma24 family protein
MRAWLYKIAMNACLDHLLKARRRRALPHLVAPSPSTAIEDRADPWPGAATQHTEATTRRD